MGSHIEYQDIEDYRDRRSALWFKRVLIIIGLGSCAALGIFSAISCGPEQTLPKDTVTVIHVVPDSAQ